MIWRAPIGHQSVGGPLRLVQQSSHVDGTLLIAAHLIEGSELLVVHTDHDLVLTGTHGLVKFDSRRERAICHPAAICREICRKFPSPSPPNRLGSPRHPIAPVGANSDLCKRRPGLTYRQHRLPRAVNCDPPAWRCPSPLAPAHPQPAHVRRFGHGRACRCSSGLPALEAARGLRE